MNMRMNKHLINISLDSWLVIGFLGFVSFLLVAGARFAPLPIQFAELDSSIERAASTDIQRAVSKASTRIRTFATIYPEAFDQVLQQAFGNKLDSGSGRALTQKAAQGQLPFARRVLFVPAALLGGAQGAYASEDGGLILLDVGMRDDTAALSNVILHEWAHHLDATLGRNDAEGEEGDIFLLGVQNAGPILPVELSRLRGSEQGHATLNFQGRVIAVEQGLFGDIFGGIAKAVTAPFKYAAKLVSDPVGTIKKTVETVGTTVADAGKAAVNTVTNTAKMTASFVSGDFKGVLNNAVNLATGPGNLLNKTAANMDKLQPGLGAAGNIAVGFTPAAVIVAGAQGLSDTVNGFKNGGVSGGLQAGLFAAVDVGMSKVGRANKGLKGAGFKKPPTPAPTTLAGKIAAAPGKGLGWLKNNTPVVNKLDKYNLTKATPKEIALGKKIMKGEPIAGISGKTIEKVVTKLGDDKVKGAISLGLKGNIPGRDRDEDGNLLGSGGSSNQKGIDMVKKQIAPDSAPKEPLCPGPSLNRASIREIQELLNIEHLGYYQGATDGIPGKGTVEAVKEFQASHNPPETGCLSKELLTSVRETARLLLGEISTTEEDIAEEVVPQHHTDPHPKKAPIRTIKKEEIKQPKPPVPAVTEIKKPAAKACNDVKSLRQCCDAVGERARTECFSNHTDPTVCEEEENNAYNSCIQAQGRSNVKSNPYTERAPQPLTPSSSGSTPTGGAGESYQESEY